MQVTQHEYMHTVSLVVLAMLLTVCCHGVYVSAVLSAVQEGGQRGPSASV